jgi:hypothetical protein
MNTHVVHAPCYNRLNFRENMDSTQGILHVVFTGDLSVFQV